MSSRPSRAAMCRGVSQAAPYCALTTSGRLVIHASSSAWSAAVRPISVRDQDAIVAGAARQWRRPVIGSRQPSQAWERPTHTKSARPTAVRLRLSGMMVLLSSGGLDGQFYARSNPRRWTVRRASSKQSEPLGTLRITVLVPRYVFCLLLWEFRRGFRNRCKQAFRLRLRARIVAGERQREARDLSGVLQ